MSFSLLEGHQSSSGLDTGSCKSLEELAASAGDCVRPWRSSTLGMAARCFDFGVEISRKRTFAVRARRMVTKLEAAEIAMNCGGVTVIAHGGRIEALTRILLGSPKGPFFSRPPA